MKNFLQHLTEVQKTYEFRIKIANIDPDEKMDVLEAALDSYGLDSISKPKRLPIKENDIDFPSMSNCQLYLLDAVLKYPVNDAQLRAIVSERAGIPQGNIVVVPKNHPEEVWRWNEDNASELRQFEKGASVLEEELPEPSKEQKDASKAYSERTSLLKELSTPKVEIEGGDTEEAKTTNDLPQGTDSPVGSKETKKPEVTSAAR